MEISITLTVDEAEALRRLAVSRRRTLEKEARAAIGAHIERAAHIEQLTREVVERQAGLLRRLAE